MKLLPTLLLGPVLQTVMPVDAPAQEPPPRVGKAVGEAFPDLELPTLDGTRTLRLSALRGKRLLLVEFASW